MNIIICPQVYGVHGIARYVQSFVGTAPESFEAILIAGGKLSEGLVTSKNIKVVNLPLPEGRFGLLSWSLAARRYIKQLSSTRNINSIIVHIPPLIPALIIPRVAPIILTAHTTYEGMTGRFDNFQHFRGQWSPIAAFFKRRLEQAIFSRSDIIISLTRQGQMELERYRVSKPISIIPNGVSRVQFTKSDVQKEIDVLFVGRVEVRKGSRPLVEVCKSLSVKQPDIKIVIVGVGDDFEYVQRQLESYKNISVEGKVEFDEVVKFYQKSKVYASTSYYEGLPGTCLEAMSCGVVPVTWDMLLYSDLIHSNVDGVKVPVNDVEKFSESILNLLSNEDCLHEMSLNAMEKIEKKYKWDVISKDLVYLFDKYGRIVNG